MCVIGFLAVEEVRCIFIYGLQAIHKWLELICSDLSVIHD